VVFVPPGEAQVAQRLGVDGEDGARRAVLRRHVADGGPVLERDGRHPGPVELDELPDDAVAAEHLGHDQDEVGGGGALGQRAAQLEAHHARREHRHRLVEHGRLGLDPAHAPAEHPEAVDHGGVRVGADERVRVGAPVTVDEHHPGQVLQVHLVADPGVRRDDQQPLEGTLSPLQELVALPVAGELDLDVAAKRVAGAGHVGHHRVVDDELGGHERVDRPGVAAEVDHGVAHGGQVDDGGHAGEVLEEDAGR
jgi:hypothetical protein